MKILIVLKKWPGGVGSVIRNVKFQLEKRGNQVDVISREEDLKLKFIEILKFRKEMKKLMKDKYDVIYTQDWSIALPLLLPYPIYKNKHFCCFHGHQQGVTKMIQSIIGNSIGKRLVVVGDSLKRRFPKALLNYNAVDYNLFKPLNKKRDAIGWINKNSEKISPEDLIKLSKTYNLKILVAKDIPYTEMNKFYNKCKIFVSLPTNVAGYNLCWVEAIAAGVPIVIGNKEGIGEKLKLNSIADQNNKITTRQELLNMKLTWSENSRKLEIHFKQCEN